ncbi:MAG: LON peptidase substrate-binding domain-containing protein [Acidobacteria bacterium]|nr:LON peptidase substrate-binding domain-containing protein [Acidobacteriota bacterium]
MKLVTVRLFPLPDVVFFPKTRLPLHIFEPRYRQLTRDALSSDRRIAIALLQPGWENDYYGNPPVYPVCCAGVIDTLEELADGKFNLMLIGERKIRISKVLNETPYRTIGGFPLQDRMPHDNSVETEWQRRQILALAMEYFQLRSTTAPDFSSLRELDYEALVNSLAAHLDLSPSQKQQLLELEELEKRAKNVAHFLQSQIEEQNILKRFQHLSPKDPRRN